VLRKINTWSKPCPPGVSRSLVRMQHLCWNNSRELFGSMKQFWTFPKESVYNA
jgi:hypothetical protein